MKLQNGAVANIENSRSSLLASANILERLNLGSAAHLPSTFRRLFGLLQLDVKTEDSNGIDDDLAVSSIDLGVTEALREIKFRARIPLPDCWTLVGIADESGFLEEGEVYACVQRKGETPIYLRGDVAISRSPAIHPGDVRVVRAVGKIRAGLAPRLSHHHNCVVFSTKGLFIFHSLDDETVPNSRHELRDSVAAFLLGRRRSGRRVSDFHWVASF